MTTTNTSSYQLNNEWKLYFHDPDESDWSEKSYVKVCTINTIEDFWTLSNILPESFYTGMFFLMRGNIKPLWEDSENINGGYFSYKIPMSETLKTWISVSSRLVAETIIDNSKAINGISISPKKGFCILKLWMKENKMDKEIKLKNVLIENDKTMFISFLKKQQFL